MIVQVDQLAGEQKNTLQRDRLRQQALGWIGNR
jgi:hypothetical protein